MNYLLYTLSTLWILYIAVNLCIYYNILSKIDDVFIVSTTLHQQNEPSISLLVFNRIEAAVSSKPIYVVSGNNSETLRLFPATRLFSGIDDRIAIGEATIETIPDDIHVTQEAEKTVLLEKTVGRAKMRLSTRTDETQRRETVRCVAPVEKKEWQRNMRDLELFLDDGLPVHFSIEGPLPRAVHQLLLKHRETRFSPWTPMRTLSEFDPNSYVNQQLAYLDCFLLYRNSARFVIFTTLDQMMSSDHIRMPQMDSLFYRNNDVAQYDKKPETKSSDERAHTLETPSVKSSMLTNSEKNASVMILEAKQVMEKIRHGVPLVTNMVFDHGRETSGTPAPIISLIHDELPSVERCNPDSDGFGCDNLKCYHWVPRYDSLYGQFFYNIHQTNSVTRFIDNC